GQQTGGDGQVDVHGVLGPGDRVVAQQHVANGTAAQGGDEGDEANTEHVHIAPPCSKGAGHGFGSDCDQIDVKKHTDILVTVSPLPLSFYLRFYAVSDCLLLRWVASQPLSSWRYGCVAYMVATVSGSDSQ